MTFEQWLTSKGWTLGYLSDHQARTLRAMWGFQYGEPPAAAKAAADAVPLTAAEARRIVSEKLTADPNLELTAAAEVVQVTAADADGDGDKTPTFHMVAYTGNAMNVGWPYPVVIDIAGLRASTRSRPVLQNHDRESIVGHTSKITRAEGQLTIEGVMSGEATRVAEIVNSSKRGFPWRVSIRTSVEKIVFVEGGKTAKANGSEFEGPVYMIRKSTLREVSFVTLAADDDTSAAVAASAGGGRRIEVTDMKFEKWVQAQGFDPEALTDEQRSTLQAAYQAEQAQAEAAAAAHGTPKVEGEPGQDRTDAEIQADAEKAVREQVTQIDAACEGFEGEDVGKLRKKALAGEISVVDLQAGLLKLTREQRPRAPGNVTAPAVDRAVLEAACYLAAGFGDKRAIELASEQAVEIADSRLRGIGIQELAAYTCALEGVELPRYQQDPRGWLKAGFSTISLPGLLGGTAQAALLEAYKYVEDTWRQIVRVASVKNFLTHTRYRLTSDMTFLKVGPDGELKHGELGEQEYTNKAETFGLLFALTRQAIINDDLGAFLDIPQQLGMGAGEAVADAVWTLVLAAVTSTFFAAGNSNYSTGATTALSIDSLSTAVQAFRDQTKPNGKPVGAQPKILAVPTALEATAWQILNSVELRDTTGSTKAGISNPHVGTLDLAVSAYLGNSSYTGYSQKGWYLFADPRKLAAFEVAFLNGKDVPTVEQTDADFNTLGIQFRGYIDFGVAEQETRAAHKMKGEV